MTRCEEVIITDNERRGNGKTTPIRSVLQVFTKDGTLLAESDPSPSRKFSKAEMLRFIKYYRENFMQVRDDMPDEQLLSGWLSNQRNEPDED